ncbi:MAG: hypothetical protein ISS77_08400 [Phycisphaerae bacterium]|nr:hypothetical protein [Phycisphaerae bacterium]
MRYFYNRKATADASCGLKMSYLKKRGMLTGEESIEKIVWTSSMRGTTTTIIVGVYLTDNPFAILMYTVTDRDGNKTDYDDKISLVTTPCNFGGVRYWFGCPWCGRRVAVLYLAPGDVNFKCRNCNNLSYHSRNNCSIARFGVISREIDKLRSEIKRWSWRGRSTRKVRRLQALERKMRALSGPVTAGIERFTARLRKNC